MASSFCCVGRVVRIQTLGAVEVGVVPFLRTIFCTLDVLCFLSEALKNLHLVGLEHAHRTKRMYHFVIHHLRDGVEQLLVIHVGVVHPHRQRDRLGDWVKHTLCALDLLYALQLHILEAEVSSVASSAR
jgi:hypothetical protein